MKLYLGSSSPRRKEILGYFNIPFQQVSPSFDEEAVPYTGDPDRYVATLAKGKADSLDLDGIVLTADTTVCLNGDILNKPLDEEEAFEMLSRLVGNTHTVYTGVYAKSPHKTASAISQTSVTFEKLTADQIRTYQKNVYGLDKAGAYAIQGVGALIVKEIKGCYTNVVGLPVQEVASVLHAVGLNIWDTLAS